MGRQTTSSTVSLTIDQCKSMMARMKENDRALFISILLCGAQARTWTWGDVVEKFLEMPMAAYQAFRDLAVSRKLTLFPFNYAGFTSAHWVSGAKLDSPIFTSPSSKRKAWTTQEVSRRFNRYGRMIGVDGVSLRVAANTHKSLLAGFGSADEAAEVLGLSPNLTLTPALSLPGRGGTRGSRDERLHGIGRRGSRRMSGSA